MPLAEAVIDCVVAPLLQRYDAPGLEVSTTLPPHARLVGPDAVIVGVAGVLTVTVVGADVALQPAALVTVTLYEPLLVTAMD